MLSCVTEQWLNVTSPITADILLRCRQGDLWRRKDVHIKSQEMYYDSSLCYSFFSLSLMLFQCFVPSVHFLPFSLCLQYSVWPYNVLLLPRSFPVSLLLYFLDFSPASFLYNWPNATVLLSRSVRIEEKSWLIESDHVFLTIMIGLGLLYFNRALLYFYLCHCSFMCLCC